jgi:beta-lactamase regulating signal transducer with metallopeptidase domain
MADPHPHQPGPAVDSVTAAVAWSDPMRILAAIWTAGALVFLGREAVRTLSLIRRIRQSVPAPEWLAALVEDTAARLGVESPRVRVSDRAMTPFVCAIPRAYLVWPAALSSGADAFAWRGVIAHELAHLKRRDPWLAWLSSFAACVWWWNPLARWIRTRLNESAEESCDAWAVSVFPDGAREFALALIRVCELVSTNRTPAPALGAGTGARRPLERRIVMILTQSIPCNRSWFGLALAGLLAAVALPAWLLGQDDPATGPASAAGSASATSDPSSEPPVSGTAPVAQGPSVPAPVSVTALPPGSTGPGVSRLDGIQSQLESLLAEIRSLRSGGTAAAAPAPSVRARVYGSDGFVVSQAGSIAPNNRSSYAVYAGTPGTDEQVLIRRTYDLPQGKADALSALLQESLPNDVETKVDGDRFTVTTTAGRQQVVADFVAMLKGENVELAVRATPYGQYPATIAPRAGSQGTTSAGGVAAPSAR